MKVFVAGATGVLGRRAIDALVAAGHEVTGVARTEEKAAWLQAHGATAARVDPFDAVAVKAAVAGHDAVVNLATHIPPLTRAALPGAWSENDRIRREVSRHLADAALAAGATVCVQESIAFSYPDGGSDWIGEDTPLDPPSLGASLLDAEAQAARVTEAGARGVVLRFGQFQAAEAVHTASQVAMARRGLHPYPGDPGAYVATIDADDAATAVVAALDAPAGTYNVTHDEPLTRGELGAVYAAAVGRRRLRSGAGTAALKAAGSRGEYLLRSQRPSNARFKAATGWAPTHPTMRETVPRLVGTEAPAAGTGPIRLLLAFLTLTAAQLGVWAAVFPRAFYDDFPGFGRSWVAVDGPYNEHLVRDFGSYNLALAVVTLVAAVTMHRVLVRSVAAAWIVLQVPHLVYHLRHLDPYGTADAVGSLVSLAATIALPAFVLVADRRAARPAAAR